MKTIHVEKILTDEQVLELKGKFINESHIKQPIIDEDTDIYYEERLLLKFRKNRFHPHLCELAFQNYRKFAKASRGRGASAGEIDPTSVYWKKRDPVETKGFSTKYLVNGSVSKMRVNNQVASQPIGYFESTKSLGVDLPCRLTHYTKECKTKFENGFPFIKEVNESYKELNPERHADQYERASVFPEYQIDDTAFSTFTINRNFQTGVHQDAGDYGFGNLTVLERGTYRGGYFVLPQFGIGIDMRQGDHLCVDVHQFHGNTKMYETQSDVRANEALEDIFRDNASVGTVGLDKKFTRLSFVFYLRENIKTKCDTTTKFIINMKKDKKKLVHHKGSVRWDAVVGAKVSMEDITSSKLYVRHNTKEAKVRGVYGCLMSHITLLRHIVDFKLNDVCVIEDDSTSDFRIPEDVKTCNHITYLGGWIVNLKMKDIKCQVVEKNSFIEGINKLENSRCLTTRCYYIPKWEMALDLLEFLDNKKKWRAIDIMMSEYVNSIYYPALSKQILGYESTIGNKKPESTMENY